MNIFVINDYLCNMAIFNQRELPIKPSNHLYNLIDVKLK